MFEIMCPIFKQNCLGEKCIGYRTYAKEVFKDTKIEKFIPIDDLDYYRGLNQEELDERFNRIVTITRECRLLGTLIETEENIDHLVPNSTKGFY